MIKIYTGPRCPTCMMLKERLKNNPNQSKISWKDVSDPTHNADAIMDDVFMLPTAITENGQKFTGVDIIIRVVNGE